MPRDSRGFYLDCRICDCAVYVPKDRYLALVRAQASPTCRDCRRICGPDERDPSVNRQRAASGDGCVMAGKPGQPIEKLKIKMATVRE